MKIKVVDVGGVSTFAFKGKIFMRPDPDNKFHSNVWKEIKKKTTREKKSFDSKSNYKQLHVFKYYSLFDHIFSLLKFRLWLNRNVDDYWTWSFLWILR